MHPLSPGGTLRRSAAVVVGPTAIASVTPGRARPRGHAPDRRRPAVDGSAARDGATGRHRTAVRALILVSCVGLALALASDPLAGQETQPKVLATTVDGAITPPVADYLAEGLRTAERDRYDAFVVRVDTPGGLDTSMRAIVRRFLGARVPVIVHVSPSGARAASAGALITFAAHLAAMAPGTAIGAATPVDLEGGSVSDKVVNDAAAFAESIARQRGRNVDFAVQTVRQGRSASAAEAVEIGAVDFLAGSLSDVLRQADGRTVEVMPEGHQVIVRSAGASVDDYEMGLFRRVQQTLADPNLAFIFMSLGTLGLIYELASPGVGVSGALGVMFVLLGLFSLSILPVNVVGLLFLLLAAALFVAELFAPGVGVAAAGGSLALVLAAVFMFRDVPGVRVSVAVLAPVAVTAAVVVVLAGRVAARSVRAVPTTGPEAMLGREVTVHRAAGSEGQAFVDGAWWSLRSPTAELEPGSVVRIVDVEGLRLVVVPKEAPQKEENDE